MVHPKPFLTPYLETPKDIATKSREARSGTQFCHRANYDADWWHRRRDILSSNKKIPTPTMIYDKKHTSVALE